MPLQGVPCFARGGRRGLALGDLTAKSGVAVLTGGEDVGMAEEPGTTRGGSGLALRIVEQIAVDRDKRRDSVLGHSSENAFVDAGERKAPMTV